GWKGKCHSVLVECKVTRSDFLADLDKPFRLKAGLGMGAERFYFAPAHVIRIEDLPAGWGLLECRGRTVEMTHRSRKDLRSEEGFRLEMNLLLASLRRVEVRIEPQTITEFLKWKKRMAEYNGGALPHGLSPVEQEPNSYLHVVPAHSRPES